jgi:hypothetical protein
VDQYKFALDTYFQTKYSNVIDYKALINEGRKF